MVSASAEGSLVWMGMCTVAEVLAYTVDAVFVAASVVVAAVAGGDFVGVYLHSLEHMSSFG